MFELILQRGAWLVPAVLLLVAAWVKFNRPPTNRSGTTFFLFYCGVIYYYALTIAIWLFTIMLVKSGSKLLPYSYVATAEDMAATAPLVAALFIVVVSHIPTIRQLDVEARSFCMQLAAIPSQADQLALNLAFRADYQARPDLMNVVKSELTENAGPRSVETNLGSGTRQARYTRVMCLYWLFVIPYLQQTQLPFSRSKRSREAYAEVLSTNGHLVEQAKVQYHKALELGASYFTSQRPTSQMADALDQSIQDLSIPVCSLIARYVLLLDATPSGRHARLASMGFDVSETESRFGRDQVAASIVAIAVVFLLLSLQFQGHAQTQPPTWTFTDNIQMAVLVALQYGLAMVAGTTVAQRFQERREGDSLPFPPVWELLFAAIVVTIMCVVLRLLFWPIVGFLGKDMLDWQESIDKFRKDWQWLVMPFVCTISIGLICSYLGSLAWTKLKFGIAGALFNAPAFVLGGLLVTQLKDSKADSALSIMEFVIVLGVCIGALALVLFASSSRSIHSPEQIESRERLRINDTLSPAHHEHETVPFGSAVRAPMEVGGYFRSSVEGIEGEYVCFRPMFGNGDIISAYLIAIRWDDIRSCLIFEERQRSDHAYTQSGRVYIPEDKQFMHLVTIDRGAVRVIMLTKPDRLGIGRGLIMTLANPNPLHFIPAASPIVLRRVEGSVPQLGFVHSGAPDYAWYMSDIGSVFPHFGLPVHVGNSPAQEPG